MDLLTTYTHHSELQVITELLQISTLYKSSQHSLSLFPACCVFISRSLATASNSGDFSASRAHVLYSQPQLLTGNYLGRSSCRQDKSSSRSTQKTPPFPLLQPNCCTCLTTGYITSFPTVTRLL
jgi:hypothetical protein